ncbi:hypothetical protein [Chitinimonas sp.]
MQATMPSGFYLSRRNTPQRPQAALVGPLPRPISNPSVPPRAVLFAR